MGVKKDFPRDGKMFLVWFGNDDVPTVVCWEEMKTRDGKSLGFGLFVSDRDLEIPGPISESSFMEWAPLPFERFEFEKDQKPVTEGEQ